MDTRRQPLRASIILVLVCAAVATLSGYAGAAVAIGGLKIDVGDMIALMSLAVATIGLFLVLRQLRQQEGVMRLAATQARYERLFEMNKYVVENPFRLKRYVSRRRYDIIKDMDEQGLREIAELDLMFDHVEFQYLSILESDPKHGDSLLRAQLTNPELLRYWHSPLRGHLDQRFESAAERLISSQRLTEDISGAAEAS